MAGFLFFSIAFGKITVSTLNAYGSFMCLATMLSGFQREAKIGRRQRLVFVLAIVGLSAAIVLAAQHDFLLHFKSFILFLLTFFTPLSAINLVDYYWVNQEQYDLAALSDPDGRYGRWNRVGIASYLFACWRSCPSSPPVLQRSAVALSGAGGHFLAGGTDRARRAVFLPSAPALAQAGPRPIRLSRCARPAPRTSPP